MGRGSGDGVVLHNPFEYLRGTIHVFGRLMEKKTFSLLCFFRLFILIYFLLFCGSRFYKDIAVVKSRSVEFIFYGSHIDIRLLNMFTDRNIIITSLNMMPCFRKADRAMPL